MSILSHLGANRHLDDDAMAELWSAAASSDPSQDGRTAKHPHLTACAQCRSRFAAFSAWLEDVRTTALDEADEAFPPERLAAQQAQIFRRLEAIERPARVIAFPKFRRPVEGTRRLVPRWVPTAVAAGLIIGLATGQFFNFAYITERSRPTSIERTSVDGASPARQSALQNGNLPSDEVLLYGDADGELAARSARYMPTLDELTPRAGDEFTRRR